MSERITIDSLEEKLSLFRKMYDAIRLVDPIGKKVLEYSDHYIKKTNKVCHAYWHNGRICDNCISVRAYRKEKSFVKLECTPHKIMLVIALPVESENPMILELLKDTTDSMMIGTGEYEKGQAIHAILQDFNKMVMMDGLTAVYNRRFLNDRLPADIAGAVLAGAPLSVIFIDVDNMKVINDTFGHAAGDRIIQKCAKILQECIRQDADWVARYGGDEFFICLNHTGNREASQVADRIQCRFREENFMIQDKKISITVSQGVVTMPKKGCTADEIIELSDQKMYKEKQRNKRGR